MEKRVLVIPLAFLIVLIVYFLKPSYEMLSLLLIAGLLWFFVFVSFLLYRFLVKKSLNDRIFEPFAISFFAGLYGGIVASFASRMMGGDSISTMVGAIVVLPPIMFFSFFIGLIVVSLLYR
jgi:hypothetical protein